MKLSLSASILLLAFLVQCAVCPLPPKTRCPLVRLANGRVRARAKGRIIKFSCSEGFTLVGNKYSTCIRGQWDTPTPVCVNAKCPTPHIPEHALMAPKYDGAILIYFCEPGYALIGPAEIFCDGRQWNGTTPHCRDTTAAAPTQCDFEKTDLCWWEQDPQHDFDWRRHNFETPSSHIGTGPTHDHTLGPGNEGYYLYIEASGRLVNDTARIISPIYNASYTDSGCFSFWSHNNRLIGGCSLGNDPRSLFEYHCTRSDRMNVFIDSPKPNNFIGFPSYNIDDPIFGRYHMFGATIGALNVYFKQENDLLPRLMFSKEGNQGNYWLHGIFNLPKVEKGFQIIIEGVRGSSYVSDIAIDDVAILQGDKCGYVEKTETEVITEGYDDQIEQVNAQQSCRGRCKNSVTYNFTTSAPPTLSDACLCTLDCAEHSICCPDYAEYCVLAYTEEWTTATDQTMIPNHEATTVAVLSTQKNTVTNMVTVRTGFSINPKDDIDPVTLRPSTSTGTSTNTSTSTNRSTNRNISTSTARPVANTTGQKTEKPTKSPRRTTPAVVTAKTVQTKETPFVQPTSVTRRYGPVDEQPDTSARWQDSEKIHRASSKFSLPGIIAVVVGILTGVSISLMVGIIILRRRKTYKRGTNGSALSEDSDVRFLTSDEILDFTLARPNDNDET